MKMPGEAQRRSTLLSIQYLRGIAALLVVFHHSRNPQSWLYNPIEGLEFGTAGVDVFFILSGFIMFVAARDEPTPEFFRRRIVRIVPLYWIATAAVVILKIATTGAPDSNYLTRLMLSLAFVPHYNSATPAEIFPVLVPGWTLNYEMFFYVIFGIGLALRGVVLFPLILIPVLVALHPLAISNGNPAAITYTDPLMLEFLLGLLLGKAYIQHPFAAGIALLAPIGAVAILASDLLEGSRILESGLPALAVVAGALAFEQSGGLPRLRLLKLLGDASYSIYLFHTLALFVVARIVHRFFPTPSVEQFWTMFVLGVATAVMCGLIAYLFIERPLWAALRHVGTSPRGRAADVKALNGSAAE
jgi:exopolysaccharide production protein ExoZ